MTNAIVQLTRRNIYQCQMDRGMSRTRYIIAGMNGIRGGGGRGENSIKVKSFRITSPRKFAPLISPIRTGGEGGGGGLFLFSTSIRTAVAERRSPSFGGHRGFRETFRAGSVLPISSPRPFSFYR